MAPRLQPTVRDIDNEAAPAEGRLFRRATAPGAVDGADLGDLWEDISGTPVLTQCTATSPYTWVAVDASGGGTITGGGTPGALAKFTGASAIGDSIASESGTTITVAGTLGATTLTGALDAVNLTGTIDNARLPTAQDAAKISSGIVSNAEFDYLDGLAGNIQAQIDLRVPKARLRHAGWYHFWPANQAPDAAGLTVAVGAAGTLSDGSDADHSYTAYTTVSNGQTIGITANASLQLFQSRHDPRLYVRLKTGADITDMRLFVGFCGGGFTADAPALHYAGVRFSTSAGDTKFVGVTSAAGAQGITAGIGANVAASTMYEIDIIVSGDGTLVTFTVNGTSATLSTNLPTTTAGMNPRAQLTNLAAETKALSLGAFYVEWD